MKPIFRNLNFWSTAIAGLALLLSQLPPIISWFPKHKIEVRISSNAGLIHNNFGYPGIILFMDISGDGNRSTTVYDIQGNLKDSSGKIINLSRVLRVDPKTPLLTPFTSVRLSPSDSVSGQFIFFSEMPADVEKRSSEFDILFSNPQLEAKERDKLINNAKAQMRPHRLDLLIPQT